MNSTTEKTLRDYRWQLRKGIVKADSAISPLRMDLERGYRWEDDAMAQALRAASGLNKVVLNVGQRLGRLLDNEKFSESNFARLVGAHNGLSTASRYLDDIIDQKKQFMAWASEPDPRKMQPFKSGYERNFMMRFSGAMHMTQLSWNAMFFAEQAAEPRKMFLDDRETSELRHHRFGPKMREKVVMEADAAAERSGQYVEVYDDDEILIYTAQPPVEHMEAAAKRAAKGAKKARRIMIGNPAKALSDWAEFRDVWSLRY